MKFSVVDHAQREQAINPDASFIVQAPAGSGKTGLLIQRILALLARVDEPEEVLAITFTRKAASEMRERIVQALRGALHGEPEDEYLRSTWQLARQALDQNERRDWQLLSNPARLRIQTIDATCASLVSQMPLLSHFGAIPAVTDDADDLYRRAAKNTIDELESNTAWSESIAHLLSHLDNRMEYLQRLICKMLSKREQWLRHVADPEHPDIDRHSLEAALGRLIETMLNDLQSVWPSEHNSELLEILRFSLAHQDGGESPSLVVAMTMGEDFADDQLAALPIWRTLANMLLTAEGRVRKTVNKRQGFPAKTAATSEPEQALFVEMKARMQALLQIMQDYPEAVEKLQTIRHLPDPQYSDDEWQTLQALFELLRLSAAQLELVFSETGSVDFTAMSRAAIQALGDEESPTDLALALDYRISHILVDEFQDTSQSQFELLKSLTVGWQDGDGRSLFLVGDPMQSIYLFREAEVGLFLETWQSGIGELSLQAVNLQVNFRSQAGIIDWVNSHFSCIMPAHDDMEIGAVRYVDSTAFHQALPGPACQLYPYFGKQETAEAEQICEIIEQARQQNPQGSIAILVRGRTHLLEIVRTLKEASLSYRAVEIEALSQRAVIQDLLALFGALTQPADRLAWLGILRAPWCGLDLADLHALCAVEDPRTVVELMSDTTVVESLSATGQKLLNRLAGILQQAMDNSQRRSLRDWIEGSWCMLGGPASLANDNDLEDAEVFFQLLEKIESAPLSDRSRELFRSIEKLFALPDVKADESLQIMTMHKSKGLEFDTVIMPGLGYRPANNDNDLMKWFERPRKPDANDLLMAPIRQAGAGLNRKYQLLADFEKQKSLFENGRLLYVASTRARQRLHLMGHVNYVINDDVAELRSPASASLLSALWPSVRKEYEEVFARYVDSLETVSETDTRNKHQVYAQSFRRLPLEWILPEAPDSWQQSSGLVVAEEELLEFDWASETARHVGTVVHEVLNQISTLPADDPGRCNAEAFLPRCENLLLQLGVGHADVKTATAKVITAIKNIIDDSRGQWIMDLSQQDARSEYALTGRLDDGLKHIVIDRTFIDKEGVRWIIDYKTGGHSGTGVNEFLDREKERYRQQLETYAQIVRLMDARPIRLGLYFPLLQAWREWSYDG